MAIEKKWDAVPPKLLTADGGQFGEIQVADTIGIKVKQRVMLSAVGQQNLELEVKRVLSKTLIHVGRPGTAITDRRVDLTAYTVSAGAFIFAEEQDKVQLKPDDKLQATYEQEPTIAWRNVLVDPLGRFYNLDNPLPVQLSDGSISIGTVNAEVEVQLSHRDDYFHPGDIHDSVRVGDGVNELQLNPDGSINVGTYERMLALLVNANFLKNANYDSVVPSFSGLGATLSYYEDGAKIAQAILTYNSPADWNLALEAYINNDDGSILTDDNDEALLLE